MQCISPWQKIKSSPSLFCLLWKPEHPKANPQIVTPTGALLARHCLLGTERTSSGPQCPWGLWMVGGEKVGVGSRGWYTWLQQEMETLGLSLPHLNLGTDFDARKIQA